MGAAQCSGCTSSARRHAVPREDREDRAAAGTLLELHSKAEEPAWHKSQSAPALATLQIGSAVSSTARPRLSLPPEDPLTEADCSISEAQLLSQTSTAASAADGGGVATSAADADSVAEDMKYLSGSSGKSSATRRMKQPRQRPQSAAARATSMGGGPLGGGREEGRGPAPGGVGAGPRAGKAAQERSSSTKTQTKGASMDEAMAPRSSPPTGQKRRTSTTKSLSKKAEEAPLKNSGPEQALGAGNCPSSRRQEHLEKELRQVQRRMQQGSQRGSDQPSIFLDSELSAGEREAKRFMFISFYREMYQRLKAKGQTQQSNLDPSAFAGQDSGSLSIQGGHRHMPRPTDVELPAEHGKPLGTISAAELIKFNCHNKRMLVSIHGDIFDVSDRPDKYSAEGPYWSMTGHDITWGLFLGNDTEECYDKYYDIFKTTPQALDRKLQGICSWWAFYENEYGAPVGRLDVYDKEWTLPAPPWEGEEACSIM